MEVADAHGVGDPRAPRGPPRRRSRRRCRRWPPAGPGARRASSVTRRSSRVAWAQARFRVSARASPRRSRAGRSSRARRSPPRAGVRRSSPGPGRRLAPALDERPIRPLGLEAGDPLAEDGGDERIDHDRRCEAGAGRRRRGAAAATMLVVRIEPARDRRAGRASPGSGSSAHSAPSPHASTSISRPRCASPERSPAPPVSQRQRDRGGAQVDGRVVLAEAQRAERPTQIDGERQGQAALRHGAEDATAEVCGGQARPSPYLRGGSALVRSCSWSRRSSGMSSSSRRRRLSG